MSNVAAERDAVEVAEFILTPFHDIVHKAKEAACNAPDEASPMRKTAESLAREGQRALNRLQPLLNKILSQHGPAFVNRIKNHEDVSDFHLQLTHLLWGFDDYLGTQNFNQDKYDELQQLCRSLAPKLYNILVRMNIELLAKIPDKEEPFHILPESTPSSSMHRSSLSASAYSWPVSTPPEGRFEPDKPDLDAALAVDNPITCLHFQSRPAASHLHRIPVHAQNKTMYSIQSPSLDYVNANLRHQSYSSLQSSLSSSNQSVAPVRQNDESASSTSPSRLVEEPMSWRHAHYHIPGAGLELPKASVAHRVSEDCALANRTQRRATFGHATAPSTGSLSKQCTIDQFSSFYRYKGFCAGAQEILKGNNGVKQKQKPVHRTLSRVVAKCTGCAMELDYDQIEMDLSNKGSGSLVKRDMHYRIRFLQKSHLSVAKATDAIYGCLFCVQNGYTFEESDATVFFSADDLFAHLSRHPRPLPPVPGVSIVYGADVPSHLRNNYDLQLNFPPRRHPIHEERTEVDGRPTGIATKEVRKADLQRNIVDRDRPEELQLAVGARLTGIKWPPQFRGKRIFAWHDGVFASAPSDIVMLIAPGSKLLSHRGIDTLVSGKAKWKFASKHGKETPWLRFNKGETIKNIACKKFRGPRGH
ncbi:hypothetical protein UVI_02040550 [Ustilaginoidea virens]|uniref:SH3 domain-containing protein n=1 Tax=Ustilaginoidea virens TaxID=1159556 RepID=A0A1B5L796_USTVR|nr:hypothetical protein UVI_02040550 [Ustilaginoidea virens]